MALLIEVAYKQILIPADQVLTVKYDNPRKALESLLRFLPCATYAPSPLSYSFGYKRMEMKLKKITCPFIYMWEQVVMITRFPVAI